MALLTWQRLDASELLDALDDGAIDSLIPDAAAIYVWRQKFIPPDSARGSAEGCAEWLDRVASAPASRLGPGAVSHCARIDGLTLGGGGLGEKKSASAARFAARRKSRGLMLGFVESLSAFTPVLYVGQTGDLRSRIKAHLRGETALGPFLKDVLGTTLNSLEFNYLPFGERNESAEVKELLELLELMAQRTTAPFGTERPG